MLFYCFFTFGKDFGGAEFGSVEGLSTTQEVGATTGQLSVSLTGAATYNVPIKAPEGINGLEPSISFAYSSQAGNGIAGARFSMWEIIVPINPLAGALSLGILSS